MTAAERGKTAGDGSTSHRIVVASATSASATATPSNLHWVVGAPPARPTAAPEVKLTTASRARPITFGAPGADKVGNDRTGSVPEPQAARAEKAREEARPTVAKGEWVIQIGAPDNAVAAAELLSRARSESRSALASAKPFTEKVQKGEATLYRARFAGLDPSEAETACKALKRSGFACFATRN